MDDKAAETLVYIRSYLSENGYPPSYREIASAIGVKSTRSVVRYLIQLKDEGKVDWSPSGHRTLHLMD